MNKRLDKARKRVFFTPELIKGLLSGVILGVISWLLFNFIFR